MYVKKKKKKSTGKNKYKREKKKYAIKKVREKKKDAKKKKSTGKKKSPGDPLRTPLGYLRIHGTTTSLSIGATSGRAGHVTSGSSTSLHLKYGLNCAHILLTP